MWITGLIVCLGWIISLCFHEFAHALVAYWGGDTSVKDKGYLTFNPLNYTNLGASLIAPLAVILISGLSFPGRAVYLNYNFLRNRWWKSLVAAAGPFVSMLLTLFLMIIFWVFSSILGDGILNLRIDELSNSNPYQIDVFLNIVFDSFAFLILLEIVGVIVNLLPIPSHDGYGIIEPWLPKKINTTLLRCEKYIYYLLFGFLLFVKASPLFGLESPSFLSNLIVDLVDIFDSIFIFFGFSFESAVVGYKLLRLPPNVIMIFTVIVILIFLQKLNKTYWYFKGKQFAIMEEYIQALLAYEQAIEIDPNYVDAWLEKGHSLNRLKRYLEAIKSYEKVINIDASNYAAWLYSGHIYFNTNNYIEAVNYYQNLVNIYPNNDEAWFHIVNTLFCSKNYKEAAKSFEESINISSKKDSNNIILPGKLICINPENIEKFNYLALCLESLKRSEEAQDIFNKINAADHQNTLVFLTQANFYYDRKDYLVAIRNFQQIAEIEPDDYTSWYNMACCYSLQKESQKAIAALKQAIKINPQKSRELAKQDRDFTVIQNDQEFQNLVYKKEQKLG